MKSFLVAALASGVSLLLSAPVLAQSPHEKRLTTVVHFSDLDLTRAEGARALLDRLQHAASVVCSQAAGAGDLNRISLYEDCIKDSMDRAVADVHVPLVSALYGKAAAVAESGSAETR